jgi:eukaryotic-like serine/threonine-protein kinase
MLRVTRAENESGLLRIALSGVIDDTTDLGPVFVDLPEQFVIDLRAIERINSVGVRKWVEFMAKLSQGHRFTLEAVSYPIVMQAICVHRFFGTGSVESCMAPFFCPKCSRSESAIVHKGEAKNALPDKHCPNCSEVMVFDELEQYFRVFEGD